MDYRKKYFKYLNKYNNLIGGAWNCTNCTYLNHDDHPNCIICGTLKETFEQRHTGGPKVKTPNPYLMRQISEIELEQIISESKQAEEIRKRKLKQDKLDLEQGLLKSKLQFEKESKESLELNQFDWYKDNTTIETYNKKVIKDIVLITKNQNILDYENQEDLIMIDLFKNKRNFSYYGGPWKYKDLSRLFHETGIYDPNIMLEHFKNGVIYSGIINYNKKKKSATYIEPEQALFEIERNPVIFQLNIVIMYIKLLLENRSKIWSNIKSIKDKSLWFELQKLFDPLLNLLIKILKLYITLPISNEYEVDLNQEHTLVELKIKAIKDFEKKSDKLSFYIKNYIFPAVKYFLEQIKDAKIFELYK